MSMSAFIRVNATAAPGLAPIAGRPPTTTKRRVTAHRRRTLLDADRTAPLVDDRPAETITLVDVGPHGSRARRRRA